MLPGGEVIRTGSNAVENGGPFFRWYGPDLTGLFTGDAGVLGIKTRITLRLIKNPTHKMACSFGFNTFEEMSAGAAAAGPGSPSAGRTRRNYRRTATHTN